MRIPAVAAAAAGAASAAVGQAAGAGTATGCETHWRDCSDGSHRLCHD